jgi:long-chain acyl-CoA synthetase
VFAEKPWVQFYESQVPATIDYPDLILPTALEATTIKHPNHPAIIFKGKKISYQIQLENITQIASALQQFGVKKGDKVAIHLPNCPQFIFAYKAILLIGGIVVRSLT